MRPIGEILKKMRLENGLSQIQAASRIHISKSRLSSYELDVNEPNLDTIIKLADLYNVSVDSLLGLDRTDYVNISSLTPEQRSIIKSIVDSYSKR